MRHCFFTRLLFMLLFALPVYASTANIQSSLDKKTIGLDEAVQLIVSSNADNMVDSPDLTPLHQDFDILSTQQSTQVASVNGQAASLTRWIITLMPKHDGLIQIPSLALGNQQTPALSLQVNKHAAQKESDKSIYLVAQATPEKPFENSQIIYIVRLFFDKNIQNGAFTEPQLKHADIMHLQSDRQYEESVDGHFYRVFEKRYAIFPEKAGSLTIPGVIFTGSILNTDPTNSHNRLFASGHWKTVRVRANPITLRVQPPPANIKLGTWLPAQKLTLEENWSESPEHFTVGEPITRTLTITATGLTANQLPSLERFQPKGFKIYLDKPILKNTTDGKTITGQRIEKYALIPQSTDEVTLPAIKMHWWNTTTNKMESALIPANTIHVHTALHDPNQTPHSTMGIPQSPQSRRWFFLSLGLFVVWVITLCLWWMKNNHFQKAQRTRALKTQNETLLSLKKKVKQACYSNNIQHCKENLIAWGNLQWPQQDIRNLGDIRKVIDDDASKEVLCDIDMHLYTVELDKEWDGKKAWKTIAVLMNQKPLKEKTLSSDPLPPLHPPHEGTS